MDDLRPSHQLLRPTPTLTNDDIEAVIQMATSSRPSPDGRSAPLKDTRTQLFVGNLPYRVRWQDLKDLFRRAGTVLRADVSLGPDNRSRGYGTVLLATAEDAGRAIDIFNGYSWQTRILEVRPDRLPPDFDANIAPGSTTSSIPASLSSTPFPDDLDYSSLLDHYHNLPNVSGPPCRNLFVGNLPFHCQWQDLKDLFRQAGTIIRADVALGQDGRSRGFGTVVFATEQDAERAVQLFNGFEYNGRQLKVNYDKYMQIGSPNALLPNILGTSLDSRTTPASPTPSFSSSVQDSRLPHARQVPSHGQPGKFSLPPGYHLDPSTSSASLSIDIWGSQLGMRVTQDAEEQESEMLRSLHRLDLESRAPSAHPMPSQLPSTTFGATSASSSMKPPSLATTTSSGSSSSVAASATSSTSDSSEPPPLQHRRLSSSSRPVTVASLSKSPSLRPGRNRSNQHLSSPHPHHPGPIALPPPPPVTAFPIGHPHTLSPYEIMHVSPLHHPLGSPSSPSFHPHHHQTQYHQQMPNRVPITPHGLPPITPSMPPFNFLPPPPTATNTTGPSLSQIQPTMAVNPLMQMGMPMTPMHSTHSHPQSDEQRRYAFLSSISGNPFGQTSPGLSNGNNGNGNHPNGCPLGPTPFSPGTMSPGAFWGRPGTSSANPMINPAVGAPVHIHHGGSPTMHHGHMNSPHGHMHSPGYLHLHSPVHGGMFYGGGGNGGQGMHEPAGYFDPGYFPPVAYATGSTGAGASFVENEILKPRDRGSDNMRDDATEERASQEDVAEEEENSDERSTDEGEESEGRSSSKSTSSASDDGDMRVWEGREGNLLEAGSGCGQVMEQDAAVISRTHSMSGKVSEGLGMPHVYRSGSEPATTHPDTVDDSGKDLKLRGEVVLEGSETKTRSAQRKSGTEAEAVS